MENRVQLKSYTAQFQFNPNPVYWRNYKDITIFGIINKFLETNKCMKSILDENFMQDRRIWQFKLLSKIDFNIFDTVYTLTTKS